jgi:tetratricopeptide (TPR) repeat protein
MSGDEAGAILDYEQALSIDSKLFFAYNSLGSCKRNKGDNAGAIEAYNKAISLKPDYYIALNNRGTAKLNTDDFAGAISDFDAALKQKPNYILAVNNMSSAYIKKKDYKAATEWANKALLIDGKLGSAYLNRGIAKQMLKDEDGACADWKKAAQFGITEGKRYSAGFCD